MYKEEPLTSALNPSRVVPPGNPATHSPWLPERDVLIKFGDRRTRAILAVLAARRSSGKQEFFVAPQIADLFSLSPRDLNWALDQLEGQVVETTKTKKGKFRMVRLIGEWETQVTPGRGSGEQWASGTSKSALAAASKVKAETCLLQDNPQLQQELLAACSDKTKQRVMGENTGIPKPAK